MSTSMMAVSEISMVQKHTKAHNMTTSMTAPAVIAPAAAIAINSLGTDQPLVSIAINQAINSRNSGNTRNGHHRHISSSSSSSNSESSEGSYTCTLNNTQDFHQDFHQDITEETTPKRGFGSNGSVSSIISSGISTSNHSIGSAIIQSLAPNLASQSHPQTPEEKQLMRTMINDLVQASEKNKQKISLKKQQKQKQQQEEEEHVEKPPTSTGDVDDMSKHHDKVYLSDPAYHGHSKTFSSETSESDKEVELADVAPIEHSGSHLVILRRQNASRGTPTHGSSSPTRSPKGSPMKSPKRSPKRSPMKSNSRHLRRRCKDALDGDLISPASLSQRSPHRQRHEQRQRKPPGRQLSSEALADLYYSHISGEGPSDVYHTEVANHVSDDDGANGSKRKLATNRSSHKTKTRASRLTKSMHTTSRKSMHNGKNIHDSKIIHNGMRTQRDRGRSRSTRDVTRSLHQPSTKGKSRDNNKSTSRSAHQRTRLGGGKASLHSPLRSPSKSKRRGRRIGIDGQDRESTRAGRTALLNEDRSSTHGCGILDLPVDPMESPKDRRQLFRQEGVSRSFSSFDYQSFAAISLEGDELLSLGSNPDNCNNGNNRTNGKNRSKSNAPATSVSIDADLNLNANTNTNTDNDGNGHGRNNRGTRNEEGDDDIQSLDGVETPAVVDDQYVFEMIAQHIPEDLRDQFPKEAMRNILMDPSFHHRGDRGGRDVAAGKTSNEIFEMPMIDSFHERPSSFANLTHRDLLKRLSSTSHLVDRLNNIDGIPDFVDIQEAEDDRSIGSISAFTSPLESMAIEDFRNGSAEQDHQIRDDDDDDDDILDEEDYYFCYDDQTKSDDEADAPDGNINFTSIIPKFSSQDNFTPTNIRSAMQRKDTVREGAKIDGITAEMQAKNDSATVMTPTPPTNVSTDGSELVLTPMTLETGFVSMSSAPTVVNLRHRTDDSGIFPPTVANQMDMMKTSATTRTTNTTADTQMSDAGLFLQPSSSRSRQFGLRMQHRAAQAPLSKATRVSFDNVQVRYYDTVLYENPACRAGASVGLGWAYQDGGTMPIQRWEDDMRYFKEEDASEQDDEEQVLGNASACSQSGMEKRRKVTPWIWEHRPSVRVYKTPKQMVLTRDQRERRLLDWGYSREEILKSIRRNRKTKFQRKQTIDNLAASRMEEIVEQAKRKLMSFASLRRKR